VVSIHGPWVLLVREVNFDNNCVGCRSMYIESYSTSSILARGGDKRRGGKDEKKVAASEALASNEAPKLTFSNLKFVDS
jgi:hypothetical protein